MKVRDADNDCGTATIFYASMEAGGGGGNISGYTNKNLHEVSYARDHTIQYTVMSTADEEST